MAEELVLNVKSDIKGVIKDTKDWKKALVEVNQQIEIQGTVINDLDKDLIKLKAEQDKIPKGAWVKGMDKLNDKIKKTSTELKLEKNALTGLKQEQNKATKEVKKFTDAQKESDKAAKEGIGNFTLMGVSLNGVKAAMGKVIPMAKAMFGSIKAGLLSTGLGAFLVLLGSLVSFFTNTKRGADLLKQSLAGIGAVVSVLTDVFSSVGEAMVSAFTDPKKAISDLWEFIKTNLMNRLTGMVDGFKAAGKIIQSAISLDWEGVKEGAENYGKALVQVGTGMDVEQQKEFLQGVKDIGTEMKKEAEAMSALTKRTQELRDADMAFQVQKAATRQEIEKARLIAEDETKSASERLENLKKALELEAETTAQELVLAKERMNIQIQEMALSENSAEDEQKLTDLKVALIEKETASVKMRRRVVTEVNSLEREILAEETARAKEKQDLLDAEKKALQDIIDLEDKRLQEQVIAAGALIDEYNTKQLSAIEQEKKALREKYQIIIDGEKEGSETRLQLEENLQSELDAVDEKSNKKRVRSFKEMSDNEVSWAEMTGDEKLNIAESTAGSLAKILGEETAAGKAAAIIQATINTYKAATSAYASMAGIPVVGPVLGGIAAAAAVASGIANVKAITSAGGGGGGGGGGISDTSTASEQPPAPQMMSGEFDLTGGEAPEPVKAFVVTDEMTNSQDQLANIRRRATI